MAASRHSHSAAAWSRTLPPLPARSHGPGRTRLPASTQTWLSYLSTRIDPSIRGCQVDFYTLQSLPSGPTAPTITSEHVAGCKVTGAGSETTVHHSSGLPATSKGTKSMKSHETGIVNLSSVRPPSGSASSEWWEERITCYVGPEALRKCERKVPEKPENQIDPTGVLWRVDFKDFPMESFTESKKATIIKVSDPTFRVVKRTYKPRKPPAAPAEGNYDLRRARQALPFRWCPASLLDKGKITTENGEVAFDHLLMKGSKKGGGILNVMTYLPFEDRIKKHPDWQGTWHAMTACMAGKAMAVRESQRRDAEERARLRDIWLS